MAKTQSSVRKLVKPEYSAEKNLTDLMDATVALYKNNMSLQAIAEDLSLNPIKVRKLLITAGVYQSDIADAVQQTFQSFRTTQDYKTAVSSTMIALHLSRPSVTSYSRKRHWLMNQKCLSQRLAATEPERSNTIQRKM